MCVGGVGLYCASRKGSFRGPGGMPSSTPSSLLSATSISSQGPSCPAAQIPELSVILLGELITTDMPPPNLVGDEGSGGHGWSLGLLGRLEDGP